MTETLMRMPAVLAAVGYGRSTVDSLVKAGKFQKPVKLAGGGAVAWRSSEVAAWIAEQGKPAQEAPIAPFAPIPAFGP